MSNPQNEALKGAKIQIGRGINMWKLTYRLPLWIYTLLFFSLVWEVYAKFSTGAGSMPPLSKVLLAFNEMVFEGSLFTALFISLQGLAIGFLLAVLVGVFVGILMGYKLMVDRAFMVYMDILTAVPMVAVIPLVVIFFGLGLSSRIVIVFLFAIVIVVVNTKTGIQDTDPQLVEMAHSYGASESQIATKILFPSAIPFMAAGIRMALGRAIVGMVTAEMILSSVGIGNLLMTATSSFRADRVFAIVLSLLILSALLISIVQIIENRILQHRREDR